MSRRTWLAALVLLAVSGTCLASQLEDRLHARFRGAWGVLGVEVYSNCAGAYNDNTVTAGGVASKAHRRFEPGELVKVDKIKVKRERVDVLVTMTEPVLRSHTDGPFELYDEAECKAQLLLAMPREVIKSSDEERIGLAIDRVLTIYPSLDAARASDAWNGREMEPYPDDYELTLARHEVWKAEQANAAVAARRERAIEDLADAADDVTDDTDYLSGLSAGIAAMRSWSTSDCGSLVTAELSQYDKKPPKDRTARTWREGFGDGQSLMFNALLAERLGRCFVPVPPPPSDPPGR